MCEIKKQERHSTTGFSPTAFTETTPLKDLSSQNIYSSSPDFCTTVWNHFGAEAYRKGPLLCRQHSIGFEHQVQFWLFCISKVGPKP